MPISPSALRQLASQVERIIPSQLSRPQITEYRNLARGVYTPGALKAQSDELRWMGQAQNAASEAQRAKFLEAAKAAEYRAARFAKLDQAASSIANAKGTYDDELRAMLLRDQNGVPSGISTFYPPGHYAGDPLADDAAYLELLGTMGQPGAGRVLLRATGMDSPSDPLIWHSTSYPETLGFYESRGGVRIPKSDIPKESLMYGNLPVFRVPRGDLIKERRGGLVRMKECHCG